MDEIIGRIRQELISNGSELAKKSGERFFREEVKLHGLKSADVGKIGKTWFDTIKDRPKEEIFTLCEDLWKSGFMEEGFIACNWSYYVRKQYKPEDILVFEKWIRNYVSNWATCDTLCNHTVGTLVQMFPDRVSFLKKWARDPGRWVKRASAVSLIIPARKGLFREDIFEIADILLMDPDDMVQKGYGWMLKAASQANQEDVFNYIMKNKTGMPRTSLRYAIEKMPGNLKKQAMAK